MVSLPWVTVCSVDFSQATPMLAAAAGAPSSSAAQPAASTAPTRTASVTGSERDRWLSMAAMLSARRPGSLASRHARRNPADLHKLAVPAAKPAGLPLRPGDGGSIVITGGIVSLRHRGKHRWPQRALATGITALLVAGLSSWVASSAAQGAAFDSCPDAFPVADLTDGMVATGLTVERGTTPDTFTATVLGVVDDGIATGLDLIIVDTDSPAIQRAGGIWAGMSGSPVYAADGRLIGAVAYSLSFGASSIAGITPAADMKEVLTRATALRAAKKVALPAALRQKLVASGAATAAQASAGMTQLAIPLGVSGLNQNRLDKVTERLQSRIPHMQVYSAGAAAIGEIGRA